MRSMARDQTPLPMGTNVPAMCECMVSGAFDSFV